MSLLNNLWSLLTTKNELASQIISTIPIFVEVWLLFRLLVSFLQLNYTKKQQIHYMVFFSLITIFFKFFVPNPFNTIINYNKTYI